MDFLFIIHFIISWVLSNLLNQLPCDAKQFVKKSALTPFLQDRNIIIYFKIALLYSKSAA